MENLKKDKKSKLIIPVAVISILVIAIAVTLYSNKRKIEARANAVPREASAIPVKIASVELKAVDDNIELTGSFEARQTLPLIAEAQGMTRQRIALMDGSTLGSEGAFLISDYGDSKAGAFGAGWEASVTAAQIVQVNQAMTDGDYRYMFDRLMMLGADTVIMKKSAMHGKGFDETDAKEAALACGYTQKDSNGEYIL